MVAGPIVSLPRRVAVGHAHRVPPLLEHLREPLGDVHRAVLASRATGERVERRAGLTVPLAAPQRNVYELFLVHPGPVTVPGAPGRGSGSWTLTVADPPSPLILEMRRVTPGVYEFLSALSEGRTVGEAIGCSTANAPDFDLAECFKTLISAEIVVDLEPFRYPTHDHSFTLSTT